MIASEVGHFALKPQYLQLFKGTRAAIRNGWREMRREDDFEGVIFYKSGEGGTRESSRAEASSSE